MQRRARRNAALMGWSAFALLLVGSTLIGLFVATRAARSWQHEADLRNFRSLQLATLELAAATPAAPIEPSATASARAIPTGLAPPDQALWSGRRIDAYRAALEKIRSIPPIEGVLRVPNVGLEVAVYSGTDEHTLNRGAGRIESTPPLGSQGNVGIAAHRDGFFRALKDIKVGDPVFVDLAAETLRYEVVDIRIVRPQDVWVLDGTEIPVVTLVTCYPFYFIGAAPERLIVRAELSRASAW